jgi:Protein of unknown function (DUF1822)
MGGNNGMTFRFAEPKEWWLEIPPPHQEEAWQQSQRHATPSSRWNAYVNQLCLDAVLESIQTEHTTEASAWLDATQIPSVWEFVNGSAITVGNKRFVLIPTETIDDGELEVPQEWVDIPSWVGDYYLVVQLRPEGDYLRVWGYTTHAELKSEGNYEAGDRVYCIDGEDLSDDMNSLWVKCQFYPEAKTIASVERLPELPATQAENLIHRLSNSSVTFPRLAVPFSLWGSLLENVKWRQNLYQSRLGTVSPAIVRLGEWLQGRFEDVWQAVDGVISPQQAADAWRTRSSLTNQSQSPVFDVNRVKVLDFGSQLGSEQVALLIGVSASSDTEVAIGLQICPTNAAYLPNEVQARLLDENGNEVAQASASVTQTIQLQFGGQQGERFSIEVTCGNKSIIENFVI